MPRAFVIKPDGEMTVNSDYFTSVELTSTEPQVVTYTINPKATWSDGAPITWEDFAAQINATSGKDKRFLFASPNGSERVATVTKGVDDRQAVITFARHFADWRGMFAGNTMLMPKIDQHSSMPRGRKMTTRSPRCRPACQAAPPGKTLPSVASGFCTPNI